MAPTRVRTPIPVEFQGGRGEGSGVIDDLGPGGRFVGSQASPAHGEAKPTPRERGRTFRKHSITHSMMPLSVS
jgi:hypothetical protein